MSYKVLIVDDLEFNQKLLDAKLKQQYYQVFTATNGREALEKAKEVKPDIVLMDVMMPEMDGYQATLAMKQDPALCHIPVIIITALNDKESKIKGLECGADDFLTKPINDHALMSRLRSLVRLKSLTDELLVRDRTMNEMGFDAPKIGLLNKFENSNVLLIDDNANEVSKISAKLSEVGINVDPCVQLEDAISMSVNKGYSTVIVNSALLGEDPLKVCADLKASDGLKFVPIILVIDEDNLPSVDTAFEVGVTDYIISPIDQSELLARTITQIRRKNYQDCLRSNIITSINNSVKDSLTNVFNRRYLEIHGRNLIVTMSDTSKPLSMLLLDIDDFKKVNDVYGHLAGDSIIKECAFRFTQNLRMTDLVSRYGGEEFLIMLPNTPLEFAKMVADRLRAVIAEAQFDIPVEPKKINKTISIGMAELIPGDTLESLIARADKGLYKAKHDGKNKVVFEGTS